MRWKYRARLRPFWKTYRLVPFCYLTPAGALRRETAALDAEGRDLWQRQSAVRRRAVENAAPLLDKFGCKGCAIDVERREAITRDKKRDWTKQAGSVVLKCPCVRTLDPVDL